MGRDVLLSSVAAALLRYLDETLTQRCGGMDWWKTHVVSSLSVAQTAQVKARNFTKLAQLDLAALLRVFQRNHGELSYWTKLPPDALTLSHVIGSMRNAQAHSSAGGDDRSPEDAWREADAALRFLQAVAPTGPELSVAERAREHAIGQVFQARGMLAPAAREPAGAPQAAPVFPPAIEPAEPPGSWPKACAVGPFIILGPGTLSSGEVQTFEGKSAAASSVPWLVRGLGAELTVHISLFDDPEDGQESGMILCVSRNASPQKWDELVGRLRIGIRSTPDNTLQMDLRTAVAKADGRPTRNVVTLKNLSHAVGVDAPASLKSVGATAIGTREQVADDKSRSRGWPCVQFPRDNLLPAIVGWVLTTALAFDKPSSKFS